jgi:DNA-binding IclR family transcriptional regulator
MSEAKNGTSSVYRHRNSTSDRTLDILMMFSDDRLTIRASELVERLGVARSTAYRYLQTLTSTGFLEETTGGYRLGLRVFELGRIARRAFAPEEIIRPVLERLARETGETALIVRRSGGHAVCMDRAEPPHRHLRLSYERGSSLTFNSGAAAAVLLAWEPPDLIDELLDRAELPAYNARSLTTPAALKKRLAEVREQGIAVSDAEIDLDATGIAAPVWHNGRVTAALSVVAVGRVAADTLEGHVSKVRMSAEIVSERMDAIV